MFNGKLSTILFSDYGAGIYNCGQQRKQFCRQSASTLHLFREYSLIMKEVVTGVHRKELLMRTYIHTYIHT